MSNQTYKFDIIEIIFSGKNREYGAFQIRKKYEFFLSVALWISIFVFVIGTTSPIIYNYLKPKEELIVNRRKVVQITELTEPPSIGEKKQMEQVEAPPPLKSTIKFLPPVVKPDEQVTEEYIPTVDELHEVDPGAKTQQGHEGGIDYSLIEVEETPEEEIVSEKVEEPYTYVEEMPGYPTGMDDLYIFIAQNVEYPEIAKRAGVEGRVFVQLVVEKNGSLTNIQVVKGIGAGCDEEALRVCKLMPKWKPGKQNGKPVRVRMHIPFLFKLQ